MSRISNVVVVRAIWRDLRAESTLHGVARLALPVAIGVPLLALILPLLNLHLPLWVWIAALAAYAFQQFARWLEPARYNGSVLVDS
ncbi:MAG: hypothetical protein H7248_02925 [Microbacteriaceae bacterium]|nr:hypothetical protein [Microbacteriaceae bacterium]